MVTPGTPWSGKVYLDMDVVEGPHAFATLEAGKAALRAQAADDGVTIQVFRLDKPAAVNGVPITFGGMPPVYALRAEGVAQ